MSNKASSSKYPFILINRTYVKILKRTEVASALACRLTKYTGKSSVPIHPKHLLTQKPWFTKYISKKDYVLDMGCGNGQNALKAAKIAKKVVGIELSGGLLEIASKTAQLKKIKNIKFKKADLEQKLEFKNQTFDKIIFLDVLEHLINRDQAVKEAKRILKKNGMLFLGVPNSETSWKTLQRKVGISSFSDPDHKVEFSEKEIKKLLTKHGFKIVNFNYGKYDTPIRGIYDVVGSLYLPAYKKITKWRQLKAQKHPIEASGFEIVASIE